MAPRYVQPNVVFFDLETTGFDRPIRPVQIGAIDSWGQNRFEEFVWPDRLVHPKATRTNGFKVIGYGNTCFYYLQTTIDSQ
jgi:DNA polymerase III epsilon subunit-like protein